VALRLLQVHFAIVMVTSGLHKLQAQEWWIGAGLWYWMYPPLETTVQEVNAIAPYREFYQVLYSAMGYAVLAWQLGFPLFAWKRGWWRVLLIGGAAVGWLGNVFIYRLPVFGPAMFVCCLAFVSPEGWRLAVDWLAELPGVNRLGRWLAPGQARRGGPAARKEEAASLVTTG
jgi:hypothetical protein